MEESLFADTIAQSLNYYLEQHQPVELEAIELL
jgi:hypothetical protein